MILSPLLFVLASSALAAGTPDARRTELAQLSVHQQIIIRIPARPQSAKGGQRVKWEEAKGPKCVPVKDIAGAALLGRERVDLIMRDNSRMRAKLEASCPALDYYHGFYIAPDSDGRVCAGRDLIRSRAGGKCTIESFRRLVPER